MAILRIERQQCEFHLLPLVPIRKCIFTAAKSIYLIFDPIFVVIAVYRIREIVDLILARSK